MVLRCLSPGSYGVQGFRQPGLIVTRGTIGAKEEMKNMNASHLRLTAILMLFASVSFAQRLDPVQWSLSSDVNETPPGAPFSLRLTATLGPGWHLYSLTTPEGGPIPTRVAFAENPTLESTSLYQPQPERRFDPNFNLETETFANEAVFLVSGHLKKDAAAGAMEVVAQVRYQACNDRQCLPPRKKTASFTLTVTPGAQAQPELIPPAAYALVKPLDQKVSSPVPATSAGKRADGMAMFMLTAFGLGIAAVFTPCVFPMIPITVSFFLNRRGGIVQAITFSLGIVVLFCLLGLGVTAAAGPFGVVKLGSNPWVNGLIALVFCVFAVSLLGAFEITLPSSFLTKLDRVSCREGYLGTLLMGLTFSFTSFACVGPFVGSLLAASVQMPGSQPVLCMLSFATGLASPFFFLAAFPSYLKKLPKRGNWIVRVKVVMGFVLLAVMLKYLTNIDQVLQTGFLTRERFLAAWLVLFSLAGVYLLGLLRLEGITSDEPLGIGRLLTASVFLVFAFSLIPAMSGSGLGELEAYVPAAGPLAAGTEGSGNSLVFLKNQYPEALAKAKEEGKAVLLTFTGYACTNCHWMKANLFTQPAIAASMKNFVLVDLYTDGSDEASEKNQEMQSSRFNTIAIPFYAIVDAEGNTISTFSGLTRDPVEWQAFLGKGARQASIQADAGAGIRGLEVASR
jgi:thiol:disulfide interchange protein